MKTLLKLTLLSIAAAGSLASAAGYPEKAIRLVVPFGAGTSTEPAPPGAALTAATSAADDRAILLPHEA